MLKNNQHLEIMRIYPRKGDRLEMELEGYLLNGAGIPMHKLCSDVERGGPFSYILGQQETLLGFDEGIVQMQLDQRKEIITTVGVLGILYKPNWPQTGFFILPKSKIKFITKLTKIN